jgi:riboflavin kinase/FMN adenylyltransferase
VRLVLKTTPEMLSLTAEEFIERFLVKGIKPSAVVEGHDFNFGRDRSGDVEALTAYGMEKEFEVVIIDPKEVRLSTGQKVRVSSTMIRYMVESGHIADAAVSLGRPYKLVGRIIEGRGKGRELGFPTANMEKPGQVIPAEGVYAGYVGFGDDYATACAAKATRRAVYSIGQARTYGEDFPLLIEAHLLDEPVEGLVDKYMAMDFVERIRSQHKFSSERELKAQIAGDCEIAKRILAKTSLE